MLRFLGIASLAAAFACAEARAELKRDIDYVGAGNPRQTLDLFAPPAVNGTKRPLVVFIHGGSWESGDKRDGMPVLQPLAATGDYVVASLNYRLTGEAKWPAQMHDCKAAIRFLRGRAAEYGIDPEKIGVIGLSAGGQLAAMLGTCRDAALEGTLGGFPQVASGVQCVVNFFGPTDFLTLAGDVDRLNEKEERTAKRLFGPEVRDLKAVARLASSVMWVTKESAPFFTAHGTRDEVVPFAQAETLHAALQKAGARSILVPMTGAGHGFQNAELNRRVRAFLDLNLLGKTAEIPGTAIPGS